MELSLKIASDKSGVTGPVLIFLNSVNGNCYFSSSNISTISRRWQKYSECADKYCFNLWEEGFASVVVSELNFSNILNREKTINTISVTDP